MWRVAPSEIVQIAGEGLKARADALTQEQAVRGLDAMAEVEFHPLLAAAFEAAGYGAFREQPYPGQPGRRPKHAERERCDLVLTPSAGTPIRDPVAELRVKDAAAGTLFARMAEALAVAPGIPPKEAFWLEVKLVGQYCFNAGVPGPNSSYSSELLSVVAADFPKLSRDRMIRHAGLLVIHFCAEERIAEHDLAQFMHRCIDKDLPVSMPSTFRFPVQDLIGNRLCTLSLVPIKPCAEEPA